MARRVLIGMLFIWISTGAAWGTDQDPLWQKAVEIASANNNWVPGHVIHEEEVYSRIGIRQENTVTHSELQRHQNRDVEVTFLKILQNGRDITEAFTEEFGRTIILEEDEVGAEKMLTVYLGRQGETITGVAFPVFGEGYGGLIHIMVGINLTGEISGITVLEHLETPGLGAKIEEPSFTDQFKDKSLENSTLVNGNLAVKKDGGDLDALTGATISPQGVAMAASAGLKIFQRHSAQILGSPQEQDTTVTIQEAGALEEEPQKSTED